MECRTCLKITEKFRDLFTEDCNLLYKIESISSIQILVNKQFSSKICDSCVTNVELLYDFCGVVRRSNMILENRVCVTQNDETCANGNRSELEDDLIQIDEIKLESDSENSYFDDPVEIKKEVDENVDVTRLKTERGKKTVKKKKVFNCTDCDFTTEHFNLLRTHRTVHKGKQESKTVCNVCGKLIRTCNLTLHMSIHTASPVTCYNCEKVLKNKECLKKHMHLHKMVSIQCTYCEKVFHKRHSYYKHIRRHKDGGAKTEKCPICEKLFYEKKFLTKHIRSHTGERPYPCEYCQKGFSSPYALKTHIRRHTNEKPFACEFCDMAFMVRVSLKTHIKSKHPSKASQHDSFLK